MKRIPLNLVAALALVCIVPLASAGMHITEWMYNGNEFIEFTNVGPAPIDMNGWSFDDSSRTPGSVNLSAFGLVQVGQSVVLSEVDAVAFRTEWGLAGSVGVIGGNSNNLGRADEINLYDAGNGLIDRLTYDDQNGQGPRTSGISGNPGTPAVLGINNANQWVLSVDGDAFASHASTGGYVGNPGTYVPEPTAIFALSLLALLVGRRR